MNSGIDFWNGLALWVGFSFLIVLTKEKIRIAFDKFLCWENILRRPTHVGKEQLGGCHQPPNPEPRLASAESTDLTRCILLMQ